MNKANKQRLTDLYMTYSKQRWPNVPDHGRPAPVWKDSTTNGLTKCIIEFLRLSGFQAERISVEGRVIDNRKTVTDVTGQQRVIGSVKRIKSSMQVGSADISSIIMSESKRVIPWKIEVKFSKSDKQSEAQRVYQEQVERAGGHYSIVRTFDDFIEQFDTLMEK